jgi:hypothetical protein
LLFCSRLLVGGSGSGSGSDSALKCRALSRCLPVRVSCYVFNMYVLALSYQILMKTANLRGRLLSLAWQYHHYCQRYFYCLQKQGGDFSFLCGPEGLPDVRRAQLLVIEGGHPYSFGMDRGSLKELWSQLLPEAQLFCRCSPWRVSPRGNSWRVTCLLWLCLLRRFMSSASVWVSTVKRPLC